MKNKVLSMVAMLTMVSMLGTNVFADVTSNGAGDTLTGTTTVTSPTINVTVPTSLSFTIDPYETATKGQIYSNDAVFTNASNVAVKLDLTATPALGSGVNLVAKGDVNTTDATNTDKDIYLALKTAKTLDATPAVTDWADESTYSVVGTSGADISVKLDEASGTLVKTAVGFTGVANPIAAWATGDVTVSLAYKVTGLTPTMANAITTVTDTLGLIQVGPVGPSVTDTQSTVKSGQNGVYALNNIGSATISSVAWVDALGVGSGNYNLPDNQYTFANGTLTIPADGASAASMIQYAPGTYNMIITLSDNTVLNTTITFE